MMIHDTASAAMIGGFSEDTEVRTDHGWKPIGDVDPAHDRVLSLDPESFAVGYSAVSALSSRPSDGSLLRFRGRRMDLLVAPDQPMLAWYKEYHGRRAPMRDGNGNAMLPPASSTTKSHLLPFGGFAYGPRHGSGAVLPIAALRGMGMPVPGKRADPEAFLELLGYCLAAGRVAGGDVRSGGYRRNAEYLSDLARRAGFGSAAAADPSGERVLRIRSGSLAAFLEPFLPPAERHVPRECLDLPSGCLEAMLWGISAGIGSSGGDGRYVYSSKSRTLLEDVQEILLKARGRLCQAVPAGAGRYAIALSERDLRGRFSRYGASEAIGYDGFVWRLALERGHAMLVRRNGVAAWCGDCSPRPPAEPLRNRAARYRVPDPETGEEIEGTLAGLAARFGANESTVRNRMACGASVGEALAGPEPRFLIYEAVLPETGEIVRGSLPALARLFGMKPDTARDRVRRGMDIRSALTAPLMRDVVYEAVLPETGEAVRGTIRELAARFGVKESTVRARLSKGMGIQNALGKQVRERIPAEYEAIDPETGEVLKGSLAFLAGRCGVKRDTVWHRLRRGVPIQEALEKPVRGRS